MTIFPPHLTPTALDFAFVDERLSPALRPSRPRTRRPYLNRSRTQSVVRDPSFALSYSPAFSFDSLTIPANKSPLASLVTLSTTFRGVSAGPTPVAFTLLRDIASTGIGITLPLANLPRLTRTRVPSSVNILADRTAHPFTGSTNDTLLRCNPCSIVAIVPGWSFCPFTCFFTVFNPETYTNARARSTRDTTPDSPRSRPLVTITRSPRNMFHDESGITLDANIFVFFADFAIADAMANAKRETPTRCDARRTRCDRSMAREEATMMIYVLFSDTRNVLYIYTCMYTRTRARASFSDTHNVLKMQTGFTRQCVVAVVVVVRFSISDIRHVLETS